MCEFLGVDFYKIRVRLQAMAHLTNPIGIFAALLSVILSGAPVFAQEEPSIDLMLEELARPDLEDWERQEERVLNHWSKSGSIAMDLLLQRGRDALDAEDYGAAIEHFTALTDHAPEFAEGWNMRATAFFLIEEFGLAIEDIGRTLALNPRHFGALNGLGVILEQLDDYQNALLAYRAAYAINPHRENLVEAIERLEIEVEGRSI